MQGKSGYRVSIEGLECQESKALVALSFQAGKWFSSASRPPFWALSALTAGLPTS